MVSNLSARDIERAVQLSQRTYHFEASMVIHNRMICKVQLVEGDLFASIFINVKKIFSKLRSVGHSIMDEGRMLNIDQ